MAGKGLHNNGRDLAMRLVGKGLSDTEVRTFLEVHRPQLERLRGTKRVAEFFGKELDDLISGAREKVLCDWPSLVDPFTEYPTPPFQLDVLPEVLQRYSNMRHAQSGFDAGGYGFASLITAANTIDHRSRLDVGPFRSPPNLYGGICGASGDGKSPIMNDAKAPVEAIEKEVLRESQRARANWEDDAADAKAEQESTAPQTPVETAPRTGRHDRGYGKVGSR